MNNKIKILIVVLAFVLTCLVAFIITSLVLGKSFFPSFGKEDNMSNVNSSEVSYGNSSVKEKTIGSLDSKEDPSEIKAISPIPEISIINRGKAGNKYTLKVECKYVPEGVAVYYKIVETDVKSNDGTFTSIPGCKTGKYTIVANNIATNETIAQLELDGFELVSDDAPVQKMSIKEFQSLLLNQNDNSLLGGKNPRVARYVQLTCVGLNSNDYAPGDIQHVRDKIANEVWKTAVVLSVNYNERGQINAATIRPVYYE